MMLAPKRHWFRWSIRTMFVVVTVFACFVGYEMNWINQRRAALDGVRFSGIEYKKADGTLAPGLLWLFGERGYSGIVLHLQERAPLQATPAEESELVRISKLFPEIRQNYIEWVPPRVRRHETDTARH